jgi:hypothetical protein
VPAEQVVEEPERETRREREGEQERSRARLPDEVVARVDHEGRQPRDGGARGERQHADDRVEDQRDGDEPVRLLGGAPSARLCGEADDGRPEPEVEQREVDGDRADERPDPEGLVPERVQRDRRDDEAGDDRGAVDGVDSEGVPPKEPHAGAAATPWRLQVSEPGAGSAACTGRT